MISSIRVADLLLLLLISQTTQAGPVQRAERGLGRGWNSVANAITTIDATLSITSDPTHLSTSANSVTAQNEDDGSTPSPIFTTIDDKPRSSPAATQPVSQSPSVVPSESTADSLSTTGTEPVFLPPPLSTISIPAATSAAGQHRSTTSAAATLPPMFSSITLPSYTTPGLQNGSSLLPANPSSSPAGAAGSLTETLGDPAATTTLPLGGEKSASPGQTMQSSLSFAFPVPGETVTASTTIAEQPAASSSTTALSTNTANVKPSSSPASIASLISWPTSPDTASSSPLSNPPSFQTTPPSSSITLQVTGTPIVGVPTLETSVPAATATVSPEVAASNLARAKSFNAIFATLTEQSACSAGQVACVKANIGKCGFDDAFDIVKCNTDTACFALPMNTTDGVILGCYDPTVAGNILGESVSVPAPGSSTSAPGQAPPSASEVVSEITTTVTPIITATSTIRITPPSSSETVSMSVPMATFTSTVLVAPPEVTPAPGFTTTIFVTRTVEPDPPSSSTTEESSTTTAEEVPTTLTTSTRRSTHSSTSPAESTTSAAATDATTITDTLTFAPIPSTVPTVLPAKATDALESF